MDLGTFFIFLIMFGLIGFVVEKFWGVNPYKLFGILSVIFVGISLFYIMWPVLIHPSNINSAVISIDRLSLWLTSFLPGALVGDVAGVIVAKTTGEA